MKACVKATGEIVEVNECGQTFKDMGMNYMDTKGLCYKSGDLDFSDNTPFDYWTRLEHQYAGMAMQGILANKDVDVLILSNEEISFIATRTIELATALVEKMKEERK